MLADFKVDQTGAGTYIVAVKLNSVEQLRLLLEFIVSNSPQPPEQRAAPNIPEDMKGGIARRRAPRSGQGRPTLLMKSNR